MSGDGDRDIGYRACLNEWRSCEAASLRAPVYSLDSTSFLDSLDVTYNNKYGIPGRAPILIKFGAFFF